ncbi:response regulator [bacterium]|nr:response regulator [bacterium]MBU1651417.1 response regulator [bacterium]
MKSDVKNHPESKTVLIVDDEDGIRDVVMEMVSEIGYSTCGADSAEAALNLVLNTPVDLVISDLRMKGMDGIDLARRLRKQFPHLPVALMTAYECDDVHQMLRNREIDRILFKPFHIDELQWIVQNLAG